MIQPDQTEVAFAAATSPWARSFTLAGMKVLIVCRGPVRKEAIQILDAAGVEAYGILLSEKDSISYTHCLAPEIRGFRYPERIHRIPDYAGAGQVERQQRIEQITRIAREGGYTHIFAGYGFMAEEADFIAAIENSSLAFMGPCSEVARRAGSKDESKRTARSLGVSVVPGVDNISALALLRKAKDLKSLEALAAKHGLAVATGKQDLEEIAEDLLQQGYSRRIELVTIAELQEETKSVCGELWKENPGSRIRLKHIGGGGGKGQRVIAKPEQVNSAVSEVLGEAKAMTPGSNRNYLLEMNIEVSRHNEIQLLGNGRWCISLGGRDCSVQMHEQKLLEVSLTRELLQVELGSSQGKRRKVLQHEIETLERMEEDAATFGQEIGLDSVSTYECIVDKGRHFFMEMNTRIQVEHRVTEMAYSLKFINPDDANDFFIVESLIEAMALVAVHGVRVPKPERITRHVSGAEVRINATNRALQPHAGGLLRWWSPPVEGEIRDDQGIGVPNPDTGLFVEYALAGAYDSNIALVLTQGTTRRDNLERLADILRCTDLGGRNVETNMDVHYGLLGWILGKDAMFTPTTAFMGHYLAAVGSVATLADAVEEETAWEILKSGYPEGAARELLEDKSTLLRRPLQTLLEDPHLLAGFVGRYDEQLWTNRKGQLALAVDPATFLEALYRYLGFDAAAGKQPAQQIWDHDRDLLTQCRNFYDNIAKRIGSSDWDKLRKVLEGKPDPRVSDGDNELWQRCQSAHRGFLTGMEYLLLPARIAEVSGFSELGIDDSLQPIVPERFRSGDEAKELIKALAPPPPASSDQIVAPTGGQYYAREAPDAPAFIEAGERFEAGQPLFIIEVMKMLNKVSAPFSGRMVKNLLDGQDGHVVLKGQPVMMIEPDEVVVVESEADRLERHIRSTKELMSQIPRIKLS